MFLQRSQFFDFSTFSICFDFSTFRSPGTFRHFWTFRLFVLLGHFSIFRDVSAFRDLSIFLFFWSRFDFFPLCAFFRHSPPVPAHSPSRSQILAGEFLDSHDSGLFASADKGQGPCPHARKEKVVGSAPPARYSAVQRKLQGRIARCCARGCRPSPPSRRRHCALDGHRQLRPPTACPSHSRSAPAAPPPQNRRRWGPPRSNSGYVVCLRRLPRRVRPRLHLLHGLAADLPPRQGGNQRGVPEISDASRSRFTRR